MNYLRLLLSLVIILSFSVQAKSEKYSEPEKLRLVNIALRNSFSNDVPSEKIQFLLQDKKYTELESLLKELEKSVDSNIVNEANFLRIYESFGKLYFKPYNDILATFNDWVSNKKSYISYAARGFFISGEAWKARGQGYINETSKDKLSKAESLWDLALSDLNESLKINNKFIPSYNRIIAIQMSTGQAGQAKKMLDEALKHIPYAYNIRDNYLEYLQPKWGGSYDDATKIIKDAQKYGEKNPLIWLLRGKVHGEQAYQFLLDENYPAAINSYSIALSYGERLFLLSNQAYAFYKMGNKKAAISNVAKIAANVSKNKKQDAINLLNYLKEEEKNKINDLGWGNFVQDW